MSLGHRKVLVNGVVRNFFVPGNNVNPRGAKTTFLGQMKSGPSKRERVIIDMKRARAVLKKAADLPEVQEEARGLAREAIKTLGSILKNKLASDQCKIAAATALLERGYGKATQTNINVNGDGKNSEVNDAELNRRINSTLERVERIAGRTREKIKSPPRSPDIRVRH